MRSRQLWCVGMLAGVMAITAIRWNEARAQPPAAPRRVLQMIAFMPAANGIPATEMSLAVFDDYSVRAESIVPIRESGPAEIAPRAQGNTWEIIQGPLVGYQVEQAQVITVPAGFHRKPGPYLFVVTNAKGPQMVRLGLTRDAAGKIKLVLNAPD